MPATITAELWNRANTTRLSTLPYASDHRWQEVLNEPGTWSLELPIDDAATTSATYGNVVRFLVDGEPAFSGIIEQRNLHFVARGEEAEQTLTLSGRGLLAEWEDAVVYPKWGVDQLPQSDVRPVNWCYPENPYFLNWPYAHVLYPKIANQIGTDPPYHEPWYPPKGWPPPIDCSWIWSSNRGNTYPAGRSLFIYVWQAPSDCLMEIYLAVDYKASFLIDGITILETDEVVENGFTDCYRMIVPVSAGYHAFGIEAWVEPNPANGLKRGMVACSAHVVPGGDAPLSAATSVFVTDGTWQCLDYPTNVPSKTAGALIYELLLEAAARGALSGWTLSFNDLVDSDGDPWPSMWEEVLQIGQDYLSVLRQLSEQYMDFTADPVAKRLNAYVRGRSGTSAATYTAGVNITELVHTEKA